GNHLDVAAAGLDDGAQHVAADTAEAVDGDANRHCWLPNLLPGGRNAAEKTRCHALNRINSQSGRTVSSAEGANRYHRTLPLVSSCQGPAERRSPPLRP